MKVVILSPNKATLFTPDLMQKLDAIGQELVFVDKVVPFEDIKELYDTDEKVLAIDPDFCDWKVPNDVLDKMVNVKAVCLQTTSFSWIDINYLKTKNIPVMNLRGFSSEAVAEWAFMMALNVARKVPLVAQNEWKFNYTDHTGIELKGRTAGIIGLGSIGTRIAEICKGFGMEVIYWSKNSKDERFKYVEIEELMKTADVILPAVAQNEETSSLISDDMLLSMKPEAIFVSVVHKIYNHELLLKLVQDGKIYGYANEEEDMKTPEIKGNIWTGLQLGWCTKESLTRNAQQWVKSITNASNGNYITQVNN